MKRIFRLPAHVYFFLTAIYLLISNLIIDIKIGGSAIDINIHDTYFIIDKLLIGHVIVAYFTILGIFYYTFYYLKIGLIRWLSLPHTVITISAIFIYQIFSNFIFNYTNFPLYDDNTNMQVVTVILFFVVAIAQILFIFNLLLSSISNFKKRHKN